MENYNKYQVINKDRLTKNLESLSENFKNIFKSSLLNVSISFKNFLFHLTPKSPKKNKNEDSDSQLSCSLSTKNIVNSANELSSMCHELKQKIILEDVEKINNFVVEKKEKFEKMEEESNKMFFEMRKDIKLAIDEMMKEYSSSKYKFDPSIIRKTKMDK